uniref:Uncharacterized protein n=1 Tax=Sphaerodactylus townsendi TaxID=933632 RepID=A0ACB8G502_9SAUR
MQEVLRTLQAYLHWRVGGPWLRIPAFAGQVEANKARVLTFVFPKTQQLDISLLAAPPASPTPPTPLHMDLEV